MSKLARSNQETMDEIDHQLSDDGDYRHRDNGPTENSRETPPFITALKNGGTKEEAIFALERMWEEQCGLRADIEGLRAEIQILQEEIQEVDNAYIELEARIKPHA